MPHPAPPPRGPHLQEDVVRLLHGAALRLGQPHGCWQADEPHAVAVTEQTAGPQRWVGIETLCHLVGKLDLLLDGRDTQCGKRFNTTDAHDDRDRG